MDNFIYGDSKRIFLNTELGCRSNCSYCYLPSLGFPKGIKNSSFDKKSPHAILESLRSNKNFIQGPSGTLLSIGCFSECWDNITKNDTIELLKLLSTHGNPIQLATKREIREKDLIKIEKIENKGSLFFFISTATIREWQFYEKGTTNPKMRFRSFDALKKFGFKSVLYIKPIIKDVTELDIDNYSFVMKNYGIPAVVGDQFIHVDKNGNSPISEKLGIIEAQDTFLIRSKLSIHGSVFSNSTEAVNFIRNLTEI